MSEQVAGWQTTRERIVLRYLTALEEEDIDTVLEVLAKAEQDAVLEEMLWQLHEVNLREELSLDDPETAREQLPPVKLLTTREELSDQRDKPYIRHMPAKLRRVSRFLQTMVAVLTVCALLGGFLVVLHTHQAGRSGVAAQPFACVVAAPQGYGLLMSVAVVTENDAWAVGSRFENNSSGSATLIEHWNGQRWQIAASPSVSDMDNVLTSVTVISSTNVWAVGQTAKQNNNHIAQTLIEHWDGQSWQIVPSKNLVQDGMNTLTGIAAISANDIWAVGTADQESPPPGKSSYQALIEHWNGQSWNLVSSPDPGAGGSTLMSVVAISKDNVWTVGGLVGRNVPLIEHWNGQAWSIVTSPVPHTKGNGIELTGIAAVGANDIWAVGNGLIEHWDGHNWHLIINNPNVVPNTVIALAPDDVWAVGSSYKKDSANFDTLVEHWDGKNWRVIASPDPGPDKNRANDLEGVAVTPSGKVWIVGFQRVAGSHTSKPLIAISSCS